MLCQPRGGGNQANQHGAAKVFRLSDVEPIAMPDAAAIAWPLVRTEHLSLQVVEGKPEERFVDRGVPEDEIIFVLHGRIEYEDGRVVETNEAAFNPPNTPRRGKYGATAPARFLRIGATPDLATPASPGDLPSRVIRPSEIDPIIRPSTGSSGRLIVDSENVSVSYWESKAGGSYPERRHPEDEIVYLFEGEIEYLDGRVLRAGEAICNLPNAPHGIRRKGVGIVRLLEIRKKIRLT